MYLGCQGSRANGFAAGGTQLSSHPVPTKDRPCPELPTVTVPPRAQNTAGDGSRSFPSLVGETEAVCRLEALLLGLRGLSLCPEAPRGRCFCFTEQGDSDTQRANVRIFFPLKAVTGDDAV